MTDRTPQEERQIMFDLNCRFWERISHANVYNRISNDRIDCSNSDNTELDQSIHMDLGSTEEYDREIPFYDDKK